MAAAQSDTTSQGADRVRGVQFAPRALTKAPPVPRWNGISVSANLSGAFLAVVSSYGEYEGAVRANLYGRYFPIVEAGIGASDHTDDATDLHYHTSSPFIRVGMDYNFLKDISSRNRAFGGARIAYSSYKYDISGPDLYDPFWHTEVPYNFHGLKGSQLWLELVGGVETQIWKAVHLGWMVRYKNRITSSNDDIGEAWYVPGFGKKGTAVIRATFSLIIDISRR